MKPKPSMMFSAPWSTGPAPSSLNSGNSTAPTTIIPATRQAARNPKRMTNRQRGSSGPSCQRGGGSVGGLNQPNSAREPQSRAPASNGGVIARSRGPYPFEVHRRLDTARFADALVISALTSRFGRRPRSMNRTSQRLGPARAGHDLRGYFTSAGKWRRQAQRAANQRGPRLEIPAGHRPPAARSRSLEDRPSRRHIRPP